MKIRRTSLVIEEIDVENIDPLIAIGTVRGPEVEWQTRENTVTYEVEREDGTTLQVTGRASGKGIKEHGSMVPRETPKKTTKKGAEDAAG